MPLCLHRFLILLSSFVCAGVTGLATDSKDSSISADDVLAFLDDPDSIFTSIEDEESDPLLDDLPEPGSSIYYASARAGVGHSNNFLKKYTEEIKSDYAQFEVDAYVSWMSEESELSILLFSEFTIYDYDLETTDESMSMAQLSYQKSTGAFDLGLKPSVAYGSFIYDSSLTAVSIASGTQIRQFYPELELYADWYGPYANLIRLSLSGSRAEFNLESLDYWDPQVELGWSRIWVPGLKTTTKAHLSRQLYDEDVARDPDGDELDPEEPLSVTRLALSQRLEWQPKAVRWLTMDLTAGIAWEDENNGSYESMKQSWLKGRFLIRNYWGRFEFSGKWGEYRYDQRWISSSDQRTALQTNRSLTIEYTRQLPWNLALLLRNQWNSLSSRDFGDSYSERRTEVLMEWSY